MDIGDAVREAAKDVPSTGRDGRVALSITDLHRRAAAPGDNRWAVTLSAGTTTEGKGSARVQHRG
ncbi:hypothetical protein GCM10022199_11810 [Marihabitans asiaticum]